MHCPLCNSEMHQGQASVSPSTADMVMGALDAVALALAGHRRAHVPQEHLYFQPDDGQGKAARIDRLGQAFRCPACLTLVLAGEVPNGPKPEAEDVAQAGKVIAEIDRLLDQGPYPTAVRLYREATGRTWDQAHADVKEWKGWPDEHKVAVVAAGLAASRGAARPGTAADQAPPATGPSL